MWKIGRNLIFPRWHARKQYVENSGKNNVSANVLTSPISSEKKKYSDESHEKKENFNRQSKRFWNCDQFQYLLSKSFILESAGWLGTVTVLCFNFHYKHFNSLYENERKKFHCCLFPKNVLAMPEDSIKKEHLQANGLLSGKQSCIVHDELSTTDVVSDPNFLEDLQIKTKQYIASFQNSAGVSCLNSSSKNAFRYFQAAARLGSSQGFYNLGLCYESGKGTKVNLSRAAFCYRKAAMKGHGLASFNLAIYFLKGMGGLPVDQTTAKLLLTEAAEKDIPEAQMYFGIECLERENWSEAYEIFNNLAKRNIPDGKYYLGLCFANGWGVKKDEKVAAEIFSQNAALGHSKSILMLSRCYEEGCGGCEFDLDFALALCQILADQGDEEGKKTLLRLKVKKDTLSITDLFKLKLSSLKLGKTQVHTSISVPELTSNESLETKSHSQSFVSSYLDLVTSFPSSKINSLEGTKPTFYIGQDKLKLGLTSAYMPCVLSNIVPVMAGKT